jgi:two-component system phosphate regulon response regulator OmpR
MRSEDKTHVLIVDDDDRLRALLKKFLREHDFLVTAVSGAAEARRKMGWFAFDVMILDVMMPKESGLELLKSLSPEIRPPVLMLSAMGEAEDRIRGLEIGADDYLPKPFDPKELVLRIKTIMRRKVPVSSDARSVTFGEYIFDLASSQLRRGSEAIYLTSNELAMLKLLAEQAGKPVTREALSNLIPGTSSERSVDVQITRLRKKIEESEGKPLYLQTVRGAGYVLYANAGAGGNGK